MSIILRFCVALPLFSLSALTLVGCGGGSGKQAVSGKVDFKGGPLDQGTISFTPLDLSKGSSGGGDIKNGVYALPAEQGLLPGKYRVSISSADHIEKAESAPGQSGPPAKERIPKKFNVESKEEVEVKASAENQFNFDIPAK
jgi:hypothetical protein